MTINNSGVGHHPEPNSDQIRLGEVTRWSELQIKGSVKNLSRGIRHFTHLTLLNLSNNRLRSLPQEIGQLVNLAHLDASSNKLESLPSELGDLGQLKNLLLNDNPIQELPAQLGRLFLIEQLDLRDTGFPKDVIQECTRLDGVRDFINELLDGIPPPAPPRIREWVAKTIGGPPETPVLTEFLVMSYNVLSASYATRQMFGYCPPGVRNWENRKKGIIKEILDREPDIITLQEVRKDHFHNFFKRELKHRWEGIFAPKSRVKKGNQELVDGCAIFYRTSKLKLVHQHVSEFSKLARINAQGSADMYNRVGSKDNISVAALFQLRQCPMQELLVCTTHLHWDPEFCDVKLVQTMMLMRELQKIYQKDIPLILTGDLNSLPDSGVGEFLRRGEVSSSHRDFKNLDSYKACLSEMMLQEYPTANDTFTNPFALGQAYEASDLPYTNYTYNFKGMIDYIFYSKNHFSCPAILGPVDPEWMAEQEVVGFPYHHVPSDHIPIVAHLKLHHG